MPRTANTEIILCWHELTFGALKVFKRECGEHVNKEAPAEYILPGYESGVEYLFSVFVDERGPEAYHDVNDVDKREDRVNDQVQWHLSKLEKISLQLIIPWVWTQRRRELWRNSRSRGRWLYSPTWGGICRCNGKSKWLREKRLQLLRTYIFRLDWQITSSEF